MSRCSFGTPQHETALPASRRHVRLQSYWEDITHSYEFKKSDTEDDCYDVCPSPVDLFS